jgi:Tfp pilus assembly protein PilF
MRRWIFLLLILGGCASATPLPPRALELNRLGAEALEEGDLATAEARLALALEFHPRFVEAMVNLGLVELSRGNHERARAFFLRARNLNEHLPHPHHGLGVLAHRQLRLQDADAHYREALRVDPAFLPSRANLGRLLFDAGALEEARVQFARLAEASPHDGRGHGGLVEALLRLGRREDAELALRRGIELAPQAPQLRLLLARRALEGGDVDSARSELLRLTSERHDALPSAHAWLALAELLRGDLAAAQRQATRALDLDQHEPVATFAMARILEARGAPEAAAWRRRVEEGRPGVGAGPWTRQMPP